MTTALNLEIKELIISSLGLEDIAPEDIDDAAPLFGEGLGLDSVDALELGLALQKHFGIQFNTKTQNLREHFTDINTLAAFVNELKNNPHT
ncbi:acyl carrier protein [Advenella kashmirensis WT001]|uniref:Acyl carrier protein n=1 Tax=Advenella kashmirensis (strain DSM 17095 / LMG 22695 / WT001) TaxID=1036672 RepID=I3UHQ3_ADVKW|nr:phosphopantetheine-binding protein [Advenella kashmirensis]AFK64541.1 acyl carrier protein [Advenella kashmirensis WT001]